MGAAGPWVADPEGGGIDAVVEWIEQTLNGMEIRFENDDLCFFCLWVKDRKEMEKATLNPRSI